MIERNTLFMGSGNTLLEENELETSAHQSEQQAFRGVFSRTSHIFENYKIL